jgi:(2Fe-2S) ferredoxin
MPKRERYLWVCGNERAPDDPRGSCAQKGSAAVYDALKVGIVKRGLRKRFRVCESSCLDLCWTGVSIAVQPDGVFYGKVELGDVPEILDALERGDLVERLMVPDELFDDPAQKPEQKRSAP